MAEIWKDLPDLPKYQASNLGRVRSFNNRWGEVKNPRIIKPALSWRGYLKVHLKGKNLFVHRLVISAFKGDEPQKQVAHKNVIRTDNRISNLRWVTAKENSIDREFHDHNGIKLNRNAVVKIRTLTSFTNKELASIFQVTPQTIRDIRNVKYWKNT